MIFFYKHTKNFEKAIEKIIQLYYNKYKYKINWRHQNAQYQIRSDNR